MALAAALASYQASIKHDPVAAAAVVGATAEHLVVLRPSEPVPLLASPLSESPPSTSSVCSSPQKPPSLAMSSCSSSSERANEHLAVLLPKNLWKPDHLAVVCDNFYCKAPFSLLERRHHCRKCGGVFCAKCTSRTTPLLDNSNLTFLTLPPNTTVADHESPQSPVLESRVCDDCWDQIWGRRPSTPLRSASPPPPSSRPARRSASTLGPSTSSISSFSNDYARPGLTRGFSNPTIASTLINHHHPVVYERHRVRSGPAAHGDKGSRRSSVTSEPSPVRSENGGHETPRRIVALRAALVSASSSSSSSSVTLPAAEKEPSYGALDAYPLRRRSLICKATGGGRWQPRNDPSVSSYRSPLPGSKMDYEVQMEEEERLEREKQLGKVIVDGDFRYRFVCSSPGSLSSSTSSSSSLSATTFSSSSPSSSSTTPSS